MKLSLLSFVSFTLCSSRTAFAALTDSSLEKHVNSLSLSNTFNPVKEAYWTGYPHHRRTPFAISPDKKVAYLAYLDSSETGVHVQPVNPDTFAATGTPVTVPGAKEAGGLVAHNDGFALLTNEPLPSGTTSAPAGSTPVAVLYRFDASGKQTWKTFLGGPGVSASSGLVASPDLNGDLVFSEVSQQYAAYFVITAYTGNAAGHFGDAVRYIDTIGKIVTISGASSDWGCSHNTGIALESADAAPFASICAEDQGAIWLNTRGQGMSTAGAKISNENTTNGGSGEPMGGMSGSYSNLARFGGGSLSYIFTWVSRGAVQLTENTWMGQGYTNARNRTNGRNVAISILSDKFTLTGEQATSQVSAASGDSQVNWITQGSADCSNAHAATFDGTNALVTWEEIAAPTCDFVAMGCRGSFSGSFFQQVNRDGEKVGEPIKSMDTYVAGDMVTLSNTRVCWPYVNMNWDLSRAVGFGGSTQTTTKISFACANLDGGASVPTPDTAPSAASSAATPTSTAPATPTATPITSPVSVGPSAPLSSSAGQAPTTALSSVTAVPISNVHPISGTATTLSFEASIGATPKPMPGKGKSCPRQRRSSKRYHRRQIRK